MFIRKHWIPLTVFVVAIAGISLYLIQTQTPKDPIVIYKPVEPMEKPTEPSTAEVPGGDTSQGGHYHEDGNGMPNRTRHLPPLMITIGERIML